MADSDLRKLADELDDAEDEITGEVNINPPPGTRVEVEQDPTGRFKTISIHDDEVTPTDPPRRPPSEPPRSGLPGVLQAAGGAVAKVVGSVNNHYTLAGLALLVVALWLYLRFR